MRRMTSHRRWHSTLPLLGLVVGYTLLVTAWVGANPPGAAADEPEHYVRAISVGMGTWIGNPTNSVRVFPGDPERAPFLHVITREVPVPVGLGAPASWSCFVNDHTGSGTCLVGGKSPLDTHQTTYQGAYPPFFYVLPGLAMRAARDPLTALLIGRTVTALVGMGFLAIAACALWDQAAGAISLLGLGLAVSPTVLSVAGTLSTSGAEIPAGVAAIAVILRLARPGQRRAWMRWTLIAALVVLVAVRPLGPIYGLFLLAFSILRFGPRALILAVRRSLTAQLGSVVVLVALVANITWDRLYLAQTLPSPREMPGLLALGLLYISEAAREMIGVFGQTDTLMPGFAYALWGLATVALIAAALQVGAHRQRRLLEATIAGVFLVGVLLALLELPTGFGVNGRQVLPVAVAIPILAGEMVRQQWGRAQGRVFQLVVVACALVVAVVQFTGWYANAHRVAAGSAGDWWFIGAPEWAPGAGWLGWILLALAGSACLGLLLWDIKTPRQQRAG